MDKFKSYLDWFRKPRRFTLLFYLGFLALCFPLVQRLVYANDLWKALYSGRYLALNLSFPHHSEFAFTPVVDYLARDSFNWLGNLVFYGLYQLGGVTALQLVLRLGLVIFVSVLIHSLINYGKNSLVLLMLFFLVVGIYQKLLLRTAIFLLPFLTLLWWLFYQAREKNRKHLIWGLPLLFLFWGNMHGSYVIGVSFLVVVFAGDLVDFTWRSTHPGWKWTGRLAAVLLAILLVVTFVKPFPDYKAARKLTQPFQVMGKLFTGGEPEKTSADGNSVKESQPGEVADSSKNSNSSAKSGSKDPGDSLYNTIKNYHQQIFVPELGERSRSAEFSYPGDHLGYFSVVSTYLIVLITLGTFLVNPAEIRFGEVLVWVYSAVLGTAFIRSLPLVALTMIPLVFVKSDRGDFDSLELGPAVHHVAIVACVVISANLGYFVLQGDMNSVVGSSMHRTGFGLHPRFTDAVPNYAREHFPGEPGFNNYNTGGYLIWKWWPEKRVFIDSKSSAYKPEFMSGYRSSTPPKLVDRFDLDHAVMTFDSNSVYYYFIPHPDWKIEVMDEWYILFVRSEKAPTRPAGAYLIISPSEVKELAVEEAQVLKSVMAFIEENQNDRDSVGKFKNLTQWKQFKLSRQ